MHILLADHRPKIRFALRALLEQWPEFDVIGEAASAEELLAQVGAVRPDLILLDWGLRGQDTIMLLRALRGCSAGAAVIVLSSRPEWREAALDAGADAFVSKIDPPERLLATIATVRPINRPDNVQGLP